MRKPIIYLGVSIVIIGLLVFWYRSLLPHRSKLFSQMITRSLEAIRADYASQSCQEFSEQELTQGYFEAFITGYCQPKAEHYDNRGDFLCAVGLNCACPAGRQAEHNCALASPYSWAACNDFDDQTIDYCHQTASMSTPGPGQIAADWSCFPAKTELSIDGQDYLVTDKGSAIKGRRFDIWFDDCQSAFKATGIYNVSIP